MLLRSLVAVLSISLLLAIAPAFADTPNSKGTVSADGLATVQLKATTLRMTTNLLARAKTLDEAVERLNARREVALAKLKDLGAEPKSEVWGHLEVQKVQVSDAELHPEKYRQATPPAQQQVPNAYHATGPQPGYAVQGFPNGYAQQGRPIPSETFYCVAMTLTADWKLDGREDAELIKSAETLKTKIEASDLSGMKAAAKSKKLPPEEEIFVPNERNPQEEHNKPNGPYSQPNAPYPHQAYAPVYNPQPTLNQIAEFPANSPCLYEYKQFSFVVNITPDQRKAARDEAFANAKINATEIAEAAGMQLGSLENCSGCESIMSTTRKLELAGYSIYFSHYYTIHATFKMQ
jgi:uncharacterized protein YggE